MYTKQKGNDVMQEKKILLICAMSFFSTYFYVYIYIYVNNFYFWHSCRQRYKNKALPTLFYLLFFFLFLFLFDANESSSRVVYMCVYRYPRTLERMKTVKTSTSSLDLFFFPLIFFVLFGLFLLLLSCLYYTQLRLSIARLSIDAFFFLFSFFYIVGLLHLSDCLYISCNL